VRNDVEVIQGIASFTGEHHLQVKSAAGEIMEVAADKILIATELIHIGQAVLVLGGTLQYFVETVFNYRTLAEAYKIAALDVWNRIAG